VSRESSEYNIVSGGFIKKKNLPHGHMLYSTHDSPSQHWAHNNYSTELELLWAPNGEGEEVVRNFPEVGTNGLAGESLLIRLLLPTMKVPLPGTTSSSNLAQEHNSLSPFQQECACAIGWKPSPWCYQQLTGIRSQIRNPVNTVGTTMEKERDN